MKGQIHVYTGDGKGKTTAAFGTVIRSFGRKRRVAILQFLKSDDSGESIFIRENVPDIKISACNSSGKFINQLDEAGIEKLKEETLAGLDLAAQIIVNNECDLLVLDELNSVLDTGLAEKHTVQKILDKRPENMDIIITGRNAPEWITEMADLVTEMKCIRHPYNEGVPARKGLDK